MANPKESNETKETNVRIHNPVTLDSILVEVVTTMTTMRLICSQIRKTYYQISISIFQYKSSNLAELLEFFNI